MRMFLRVCVIVMCMFVRVFVSMSKEKRDLTTRGWESMRETVSEEVCGISLH